MMKDAPKKGHHHAPPPKQKRQRRSMPTIPWGAKTASAISAAFGAGVMFLTATGDEALVSLYAGLGSFLIALAVTLGIWAIARKAKEDNW